MFPGWPRPSLCGNGTIKRLRGFELKARTVEVVDVADVLEPIGYVLKLPVR